MIKSTAPPAGPRPPRGNNGLAERGAMEHGTGGGGGGHVSRTSTRSAKMKSNLPGAGSATVLLKPFFDLPVLPCALRCSCLPPVGGYSVLVRPADAVALSSEPRYFYIFGFFGFCSFTIGAARQKKQKKTHYYSIYTGKFSSSHQKYSISSFKKTHSRAVSTSALLRSDDAL